MKLKKEHYAEICEAIDNDIEEYTPDYSVDDVSIAEVTDIVTECEIDNIRVTCSTNVEYVNVFDEWRVKSSVSFITKCAMVDDDGFEVEVESDKRMNKVFGLITEYENKKEIWRNN